MSEKFGNVLHIHEKIIMSEPRLENNQLDVIDMYTQCGRVYAKTIDPRVNIRKVLKYILEQN